MAMGVTRRRLSTLHVTAWFVPSQAAQRFVLFTSIARAQPTVRAEEALNVNI